MLGPLDGKPPAERARAQTKKARSSLRELILAGRVVPGERLSEAALAERLEVSRTPARMAMIALEKEGLLVEHPTGGFSVREFTEGEVLDAIEIRGMLEGLAARFAAERGLRKAELLPLRACVAAMDRALTPGAAACPDAFAAEDDAFHAIVCHLSGSPTIARQLERAAPAPFASLSGILPGLRRLGDVERILIVAQDQHQSVLEALERRDGRRAEALMLEHARLTSRHLGRLLRDEEAARLVPGAGLIRMP